MSKNNPRPEFMANLKTLCKDFDKQVNDLDLETRATLHHNRVRICTQNFKFSNLISY